MTTVFDKIATATMDATSKQAGEITTDKKEIGAADIDAAALDESINNGSQDSESRLPIKSGADQTQSLFKKDSDVEEPPAYDPKFADSGSKPETILGGSPDQRNQKFNIQEGKATSLVHQYNNRLNLEQKLEASFH